MFRARLKQCAAIVVAVTACWINQVWAQPSGYPTKPVRIIVPFPQGQGTDVATRHLAEQLGKALGQNFYVDNRPGAASRLGIELLAKAAPDGYTLGIGTAGTHTINPNVFSNLGYDPEKDFDPICLTGNLPLLFAAHPSLPANNMAELIALAKNKPDSLNVALPALPQRIAFELLRQQTGAGLFAVPYKGSSSALPEVMGGQVPLIVDSLTALRPHVDSGRLKALGVTSLKSTDLMPQVKSVAEQGVPGYELTAWNAFFAPKGTPPTIVTLLNQELRRILQQPETRQRLGALGFEIVGSTPQQLADTVRSEREKWGAIIRTNHIQAE
jgi:tripartite-type tricarboxylate transporter receptor subunit TctC